MKKYSVGIDLGTTHSCVGVYDKDGKVIIIANEHGNRTTPSFVAFKGDERYIGQTAKDNVGSNPHNTVYDVKRLIGMKYSDPIVQKEKKYLSFKVTSDNDDKPIINVDYLGEKKQFHPEEISAMVLAKMKSIAENYIGEEVKDVVITVPAYFGNSQKEATKQAGEIAGLNVMRIINEPTAAAIAYGLNNKEEKRVLVYDFGGGTLDVTILHMNCGVFKVLCTKGEPHLGGEDFDNKIREFCLLKFATKYIIKKKLSMESKKELLQLFNVSSMSKLFDISLEDYGVRLDEVEFSSSELKEYAIGVKKVIKLQSKVKLMRKLKTKCEDAKKALSTCNSIGVEMDEFYDDNDLDIKLSRTQFELLCKEEFERCMTPVDLALKDAHMTHKDIDDVVLVGGSTRIPKIHKLLNERFPDKIKSNINPDEAVAYGASVQAAILNQDFDSVTGEIIVRDIAPLSLGIETYGGRFKCMIPRGTHIPCEETEIYTTSHDNQAIVTVKVYEGEAKMTERNTELGKFNLENIPPMKKKKPRIHVTFSVNENGLMSVSAKEEQSGNTKDIVIKNDGSRLSKKQINDMINVAEEFAKKDGETADNIAAKLKLEGCMDAFRESIENSKFFVIMGENVCKQLTKSLNIISGWIDDEEDHQADECRKRQKQLEDEFLPLLEKYQLQLNKLKNGSDNKSTKTVENIEVDN